MARPHGRPARRLPVASLTVFALSGTVAVAQWWHPQLLDALSRDPDRLADGQWWRVLTPLLAQDPPVQSLLTVPAVAVLGIPVEKAYGSRGMLAIYLSAGLAGEAFGYLWQPRGAGNSVADLGMLGALAVYLASAEGNARLPQALRWPLRYWGAALAATAVAGTCLRNLHAPAALIGAGVGALLLSRRRRLR